jgi:transcriptional regulator with XRE-family HTH domain
MLCRPSPGCDRNETDVEAGDSMPRKSDPPPALVAFAEELKAWRAQSGLSREDVAVKVNYSSSLIGMIETCQRNPTPTLAGLLDRLFGTPQTFTRHEKRMRGIPFSAGFRPFQPYEAAATTLWLFEHALVPGLFQTEDYARAILSAHPNTSAEVVEERVVARLARQEILTREDPPPPVVWALLDENALRREIGGPKVMAAQLARLLQEARLPSTTIQVIPRSVAHSGLHGAFVVAEVPDSPDMVVYLETVDGGQTVEDPGTAARMSLRFSGLRTEALTGSASVSLIERVMDEWNGSD